MAKSFKASFFRLACLFSFFLLTSCQEGGDAGDLLGQWRLTGSDTKYVSFSGSLTLLRSINEGEVFGKFQHVGDSLFIQCYSIYGVPSDTALVENSFGFKPFQDIHVKIDALTSSKLVISQDSQTWSFYKY